MSAWRSIVVLVGLSSAALFVASAASCWSGDIVFYSDDDAGACETADGGADGAGGSGGGCP